jgi:hypothetical protein
MKKLYAVLTLIILWGILAGSNAIVQGQEKATATPTGTPTPTQTATATIVHAWQGYVLVEFTSTSTVEALSKGMGDVDLTARVREAFAQLAPERGSWPPYLLQIGPLRLDGQAVIVEGRFDRMPDAATVADRLGSRLGTDRKSIEESLTLTLFAPGGTWEESQAATLRYLEENAKDWQPPMDERGLPVEEPREEPIEAPAEGQVEG